MNSTQEEPEAGGGGEGGLHDGNCEEGEREGGADKQAGRKLKFEFKEQGNEIRMV